MSESKAAAALKQMSHINFEAECHAKDLAYLNTQLPPEKYESKDWREGCLSERIQLLITMYEEARAQVCELNAQLDAIGAGGVEPLRKRECLHRIEEPVASIDSPFNACMYQEQCKQWRDATGAKQPMDTLWEKLLSAAIEVNECTQIAYRPPVRDQFEFGRMVLVRLHALAYLYDAAQAVNAAHGVNKEGAAA